MGGVGGQFLAFPIDFDRRPYNTTVRMCDHYSAYSILRPHDGSAVQ